MGMGVIVCGYFYYFEYLVHLPRLLTMDVVCTYGFRIVAQLLKYIYTQIFIHMTIGYF